MARRKQGKPQTKAKAGRKAAPKPVPKPGGMRRFLRRAAVALVWLGIALVCVLAYFAYDLPSTEGLAEPVRGPSITLVGHDGTRIASHVALFGEAVQIGDVPAYLPQAVLATEDRRFYDHPGVDPVGVLRALVANLRAGHVVQGGSTITQQLAKNLFLGPERTLRRKIQETILALWLEQRYSKDEILTIYLNRVYFGAGAYGVEAAARRYFGKPASALGLYEAAMLAGLLKAPSRYNPARDGDLARQRTAVVLDNMVAAGFLDPEMAKRAGEQRARTDLGGGGWEGRHFVDWVLEQVPAFVGAPDTNLIVVTTLDARLQRVAEQALAGLLDTAGAESGAGQAALLAMTPGGAIRAMVGGRDYRTSQFNRATQAFRQPGSAFKLFVYLAGLEAGLSPRSRVQDAPVTVEGWSPGNYTDRFLGDIDLTEALAKSVNTAAVRVSEQVGRKRVSNAARRLGLTGDIPAGPSLALGTGEVTLLELTQAYATVANGGAGVWSYAIEEIRDETGEVLYRRSGSGPGTVLAPGTVRDMTRMLTAVVTQGTGRAADIGRPAAGKTGTSQDYRDAWFVGFTAELAAGIWMGNDDGAPMNKVTGGGLPARLWAAFMKAALEGQPVRPLPGLALLDSGPIAAAPETVAPPSPPQPISRAVPMPRPAKASSAPSRENPR
ncbi:MAG: PBP1A family penicillin-binding protein [Rhodospirillaceae bacterium]|jgi:penicillin-binding protein 1A|nr:PBP1A family penicillin-binding protein [Rhodospirillaceae bacterium]